MRTKTASLAGVDSRRYGNISALAGRKLDRNEMKDAALLIEIFKYRYKVNYNRKKKCTEKEITPYHFLDLVNRFPKLYNNLCVLRRNKIDDNIELLLENTINEILDRDLTKEKTSVLINLVKAINTNIDEKNHPIFNFQVNINSKDDVDMARAEVFKKFLNDPSSMKKLSDHIDIPPEDIKEIGNNGKTTPKTT